MPETAVENTQKTEQKKAKEIKVEEVAKYALLGTVLGHFPEKAPSELEEKINIVVRNFADDVDLMEEMTKLKQYFPKAEIHVYRSGTRDTWR